MCVLCFHLDHKTQWLSFICDILAKSQRGCDGCNQRLKTVNPGLVDTAPLPFGFKNNSIAFSNPEFPSTQSVTRQDHWANL